MPKEHSKFKCRSNTVTRACGHTKTHLDTHTLCKDPHLWSVTRCFFTPRVLCVWWLANCTSPQTHTQTYLAPIQLYRALSKTSAQALGHSSKKYHSNTLFLVHVHLEITQPCVRTHIHYIFCGPHIAAPSAQRDGVMLEEGMG